MLHVPITILDHALVHFTTFISSVPFSLISTQKRGFTCCHRIFELTTCLFFYLFTVFSVMDVVDLFLGATSRSTIDEMDSSISRNGVKLVVSKLRC